MQLNQLHQHDEELTPQECAEQELAEEMDFGFWPELVGLIGVVAIVWLMFASFDGAF
jgi:hypothetical protein